MSMERAQQARAQLERLAEVVRGLPEPMGARLARECGRDPFILLVACLLSLRARDAVVYPVVRALFQQVPGIAELAVLNRDELEALLRPIGFFRAKAAALQRVAQLLIDRHGGQVPCDEAGLRALSGVGPKTVAFMQAYAYNEPALCVDTHVHRLANRFGWVCTSSPERTEERLKQLFPKELWPTVHTTLLTWGQQVCGPRGVVRGRSELHEQYCPCAGFRF